MIRKRVLGAACAGVVVTSLGVLAACSGDADGESSGSTAQAAQAANVSIVLHDENGARVGDGSGILIAPRLVLTSAHLVAGKSRWTVTSDGKTKAIGTRGLTYDWMEYESNKSHPRKHDLAVIYLDKPITLSSYPKISAVRAAPGTEVHRVRGRGNGDFELLSTKLDRIRSFPYAYTTSIPGSETLDTGGAVLSDKNEIVGVVTGRGLSTGKLYVARVDDLVAWLSPKIACAGGKVSESLGVRTSGTPKKPGCKKDGGTGSSSGGSSGNGGSSSSSGGSSSGSSGSSSSSGGSSGGGGGCDDSGGNCNGDCSGGSSSSSGGSSGSDGASSSGSRGGSSGNDGASSSSSSGSSGASSSGSSGSSGNDGASSSGSGGGGPDQCEGPHDDPEVCPPEPGGCTGPGCGGGTPDGTIDYGNCGCNSGSNDGPIILR